MPEPVPEAATGGRDRQVRLLLVLLLSLAAWLQFTVAARTEVAYPLRSDAGEYFSYAYNLHHSGVYSMEPTWRDPARQAVPDALRTPGYPLFLLLAGEPVPDLAWLHRISLLQAGLGVASVLLAWLVSRRFLGEKLALLAGLMVAINPWLVAANTYLLTESLFTFLLLAATLQTLRAVDAVGGRPWQALAAGLLWGLCSLVRPTMQFLPLACVLLSLLPAMKTCRRPALLVLLGFALAVSPWVLRNQLVDVGDSGSRLMVNALAHGSYPGFMYRDQAESFEFPYRHDPEYANFSRDLPSVLAHIGAEFRRQPLRQAQWYLLGKPWYFLSLEDVQSSDIMIYPLLRSPYFGDRRFESMRSFVRAVHWPLVLLALLAMALLALRAGALGLDERERRAAMLVAIAVAYAIALHMVVAPFPRYSIPFRPLLFALALLPLQAAWRAWRGRQAAAGI